MPRSPGALGPQAATQLFWVHLVARLQHEALRPCPPQPCAVALTPQPRTLLLDPLVPWSALPHPGHSQAPGLCQSLPLVLEGHGASSGFARSRQPGGSRRVALLVAGSAWELQLPGAQAAFATGPQHCLPAWPPSPLSLWTAACWGGLRWPGLPSPASGPPLGLAFTMLVRGHLPSRGLCHPCPPPSLRYSPQATLVLSQAAGPGSMPLPQGLGLVCHTRSKPKGRDFPWWRSG